MAGRPPAFGSRLLICSLSLSLLLRGVGQSWAAQTLTVTSLNPGAGILVSVSPADNSGQGDGTTPFSRTYQNNTAVHLTAPERWSGNQFQKWQRGGVDWGTNLSTTVTMNGSYTMNAVYVTPPVLTIGAGAWLKPGIAGLPYSYSLTATGGAPPYAWAVVSNALPPGITLGPTNGLLSGMPTTATSHQPLIRVTGTNGAYAELLCGLTNEPLPFLQDMAVTEGNSGTNVVFLPVRLAVPADHQVRVRCLDAGSTAAHPATWGSDFLGFYETLVFAPGQTNLPVAIPIVGDLAPEFDEGFNALAVGEYSSLYVDDYDYATITILNDDEITPLTITSGSWLNPGLVNYSYSCQLQARGGIPPYYWSIVSNGLPLGITLNATNALLSGTPTTATSHQPLIRVADARGVYAELLCGLTNDPVPSVSAASVQEGDTATNYAAVPVSLAMAADHPVKVHYFALDLSPGPWGDPVAKQGEDYLNPNGYLTFGVGETQKTAPIAIIPDLRDEFTEQFRVVVEPEYRSLYAVSSTDFVTITDNDPPALYSVSDAAVFEGNGGTTYAIITVSLSKPSGKWFGGTQGDYYGCSDGTAQLSDSPYSHDFLQGWYLPGSFYLAPGETNKTFQLPLYGDTRLEPDEYFYFSVHLAHGTAGRNVGVCTILNDDVGMDSFERDTNGVVRFRLLGVTGTNYVIQASSDLQTWSDIATNLIATGGATNFIDFSATNQPCRYYRARSQ